MTRAIVLSVVLIMSCLSTPASAQIFVDDSAEGNNDGSSWTNAFNYLQDALQIAEPGDEIRVAQGTYRPDQGDEVSTADREAVFGLKTGLTIKGGYAGFGAADPDQRDCQACRTVLSGDLAGNDVDLPFARDLLSEPTRSDNSHSILYVGKYITDPPPLIDGFTIKGASDRALNMYHSDILVTDCVFQANTAASSGAAMYSDNSRAVFTRCSFIDNAAAENGGAVYSDGCGTCRSMFAAFVDCLFEGNHAGESGGAVYSTSTTLTTAINCLFVGNTANSSGAAVYENSYSYGNQLGSHLVNCTFSGNNCIAVYIGEYGYASLTSCILWDNLCGTNGGIDAQISCQVGDKTAGSGSVNVNYCCIDGWDGSLGGDGNFSDNPSLVLPGYWDLNLNYTAGDYHLESDSPCINTGNPAFTVAPTNPQIPSAYYFPGEDDIHEYILQSSEEDLDGASRMSGGQVDIGPYERYATASVVYVDDTATGDNDGSTWTDAFNYLQDALETAPNGHEIRVAQGTYRPDQGDEVSTGDRSATFNLRNRVPLRGGYAGFGQPDPDARDFDRYETILTGDLAANDAVPLYARDMLTDDARNDNSYRVVMVDRDPAGNTPTIEGFTITGGNAEFQGAGLFMDHYDAIVTDCIFIHNSSSDHGAGFASDNSRAIFTRCSFIRNAATENGGAVYIDGCGTCRTMYAAFIDCTFMENYAGTYGGAVCTKSEGLATYINCLFIGNTADSLGAALYEGSSALGSHLVNCTFSGNNRVAVYVAQNGSANLTNCILWNNLGGAGQDAQIAREQTGTAVAVVNYSCIQGWDGSIGGPGNFDADPRFVTPGTWDIDLNYAPGDYHLRYDSPCIDAGDPTYIAAPTSVRIPTEYYIYSADPDYLATSSQMDLDAAPRLAGGRVDAGPYEGAAVPSIYVDDTATGANNGSTWADAYNYLQDALEAVPDGHEIWVAQGTYRPDQGDKVSAGDRDATFLLARTVTIRGGYAGAGATNPSNRNINQYPTILTGDLAADDIGDLYDTSRIDNSLHVVTINEGTHDATLDGFTITGGNANGNYAGKTDRGGGVYKIHESSATLTDCTIIANSASSEGGGMSNEGPLTLDKCRFIGNIASSGGGMESSSDSDDPATLTNCLFTGNLAASDGGAISTKCATIRCTNCTFSFNRAEGRGFYRGGGITGDDDTDMWLTNCIFWGNSDADGTAESSQIFQDYISQTRVNYCCVQGWTGILGGEGNFASDPLFIDPDGQDNTAGTEDDNLRIDPASPCINAGDPEYRLRPGETDLDDNPRISEGRVDMGAYEFSHTVEYTRYDIIDLGTLGGEDSVAYAINNYGQIVGWSHIAEGNTRATLFDYANIANNRDLGTLGGRHSQAFSINIHGQSVGNALTAGVDPHFHAVLFGPDQEENADLGNSSQNWHWAYSINDFGQIVGNAIGEADGWEATLFDSLDPNNNIDLAGELSNPYGSDNSCALSINNNGQIVGYAHTGTTSIRERAVLFDPTGAGDNTILTPDEDDGGEARSVNDAGQIVGWSLRTGGAAIFNQNDPGNNIALGALPGAIESKAYSVNNRGQIVGSVQFWEEALSYYSHATIFDPTGNGDNRDLNELIDYNTGWELTKAYGINDAGWIVGYGRYQGGTRAFLLIPRQSSTLVAHWKLDESEGNTAKDSVGNNDGTLNGGPLWLPNEGRVEGALLLDGQDDYVDCGANSDFDITGRITVAAWVNINTVNMNWQTVIAKGDSAWRLSTAENEYRYHFAVTGGPPWNYINGDVVVAAGEWHHVCGTYDGAHLRLYIDGAEDPAGPVPEAAGVTTNDFDVLIGENQERTGRQWDGMIDDVRIYDYALSSAEVSQLVAPTVIYVDADAPGLNNGCCWADAFNCLQDALALAIYGSEIRVALGRYTPDCGQGITPRDRDATFQLKNGVTIKGGYAGYGHPNPDRCDTGLCKTTLSGDLLGNDVEVADPCHLPDEPTRDENSYNVVTGSGTDRTAILDGFTITGGNTHNRGAGIYNNIGSPTLYDCTFVANSADDGGGMANCDNSNPLLTNCNFSGNAVSAEEGSYGGGIYNRNSNPVLINCTFTGNFADVDIPDHGGGYGGGIYNSQSSPTITDCIFNENRARCNGGAMANDHESHATVTNCTFTANAAWGSWGRWGRGGGMYNNQANPTITNCTFTGNLALRGAGMANNQEAQPRIAECTFTENSAQNGGGMDSDNCSPILTDCTFSRNSSEHSGGGIYFDTWCSPILVNCTLTDNTASSSGGGIFFSTHDAPTLTDCTITRNAAQWNGGGIGLDESVYPTLTNCVIAGNTAAHSGGGMSCDWDNLPILTNCLIVGNIAVEKGGGIYAWGQTTLSLTNCTLSDNFASDYGGALCCQDNAGSTLSNCILSGNAANQGSEIAVIQDRLDRTSTVTVAYSNIGAGVFVDTGSTLIWDIGNIAADPCFALPGYWDDNATANVDDDRWVAGDYHLKSFGYRWDPQREQWTFDRDTSRCIDAGNPGSPLLDELLAIPEDPLNEYSENIRINMGAYGGTAQASLPPLDWAILADINNDGTADFCDLACTGPYWALTAPQQPCDLDRSGETGPADLDIFADDWLKTTLWRE